MIQKRGVKEVRS